MGGRQAEVGVLEQIREAVASRLRNDQALVGRRYAYALPYHAVAIVSYELPEILEALWTSRFDYDYKESRLGGVLTETLEFDLEVAVEAGVAQLPVIVEAGEELSVNVEYQGLSLVVETMLKSKSN